MDRNGQQNDTQASVPSGMLNIGCDITDPF